MYVATGTSAIPSGLFAGLPWIFIRLFQKIQQKILAEPLRSGVNDSEHGISSSVRLFFYTINPFPTNVPLLYSIFLMPSKAIAVEPWLKVS